MKVIQETISARKISATHTQLRLCNFSRTAEQAQSTSTLYRQQSGVLIDFQPHYPTELVTHRPALDYEKRWTLYDSFVPRMMQ